MVCSIAQTEQGPVCATPSVTRTNIAPDQYCEHLK